MAQITKRTVSILLFLHFISTYKPEELQSAPIRLNRRRKTEFVSAGGNFTETQFYRNTILQKHNFVFAQLSNFHSKWIVLPLESTEVLKY